MPKRDELEPERLARLREFFSLLAGAMAEGRFVGLSLGKFRGAGETQRVQVRPVDHKGEARWSWVIHWPTRDETHNLSEAEGMARLRDVLGDPFRGAHLFTTTGDTQLEFGKKGQAWLSHSRASHTEAPTLAHDRDKQRLIDVAEPFLAALGVTDTQHQVLPSMSRKWKQINKFLEIVRGAVGSADFAPGAEIRVVDFGAGKGYLTFAAHAFLRQTLGYDARVFGVELRPALVDFCNGVARALDLAGLDFHAGDIARFQPERLDLLIALHACDTATDLALFQGVRLGARVLIAAPCCHKEVRPQITVPDSLRPVLRHGIHLGQEADMVTDSLRALCLEACGYETKILEFVALEHTAKNKMILAVKRKGGGDTAKAAADLRALLAFYGIREQSLEKQLREAGHLPA